MRTRMRQGYALEVADASAGGAAKKTVDFAEILARLTVHRRKVFLANARCHKARRANAVGPTLWCVGRPV